MASLNSCANPAIRCFSATCYGRMPTRTGSPLFQPGAARSANGVFQNSNDVLAIHSQSNATAPRSGRKSGRSATIEIITRNARRRWSLEQKREIVAESLGPGLTPTEVARKHEISSGQLYTWRRDLLATGFWSRRRAT